MARKNIAIVGYGYRMPGGIHNDNDYWELLSQRKVIQCPVKDRYGEGYEPFAGNPGPGRFANKFEGLMLDGEELNFDCKLFGMSPYEAEQMDPQIKLLLSSTWDAFEHAGWDMHKLRNSNTGVFVGTQISAACNWRSPLGANEFTIPGSSLSMFANRISYHFNLMGPSTTTLTACSSGISALHSAMNSLQCGDCEQAVVGSSNYLGSYLASTGFGSLGVISPDGKCHSFDANANGYMRSEGVFTFVLKPVAAAERDGDKIHAVISETLLNTAGAAEGTTDLIQGRYITAPTPHAQIDLMQQACERVGIEPQQFSYIEAHATGTKLGDRIEGNAIGEVFGGYDRKNPLRVAGVKSNLGHMEAAAFHCSLLKIILMIQRRTFAPISENYKIGNPEIDFAGLNMKVQTTCEAFPEEPVVIGINSFGFGGANGICIIEEYQPNASTQYSKPLVEGAGLLFPISARSTEALENYVKELKTVLSENTIDPYDLASNLSLRRTHFGIRSALVAKDQQGLLDTLQEFDVKENLNQLSGQKDDRILMVFSGQGTQWAGCAKELYATNPVFKKTIDAIEGYWKRYSSSSLRDACFNASQEELNECELAQPAIFMIQCALVETLKTWGVYADGVIGHSAGEMAAAYASGALSLEDASRLVFHRAKLQQRTAGSGRMLAIALDLNGVEDFLNELEIPFSGDQAQVEIACVNAPASVVICGTQQNLDPIVEELTKRNYQKKLLAGNIAFHSSAMNEIKEDLIDSLTFLDEGAFEANIPFISSVTGKVTSRLDSQYWWSNIRKPVQFYEAIKAAERAIKPTIILEVAPHHALTPIIQQCFEQSKEMPVCISTLKRKTDTSISFYQSLGKLFQHGVTLDFEAQYPRPRPITDLLPGHTKEEQPTMDILIDDTHFLKNSQYSTGPLVGKQSATDNLSFEVRMSAKDFPWLTDHKVQKMSIVPAAGYIEIVLQALGNQPAHFDHLKFRNPCVIGDTPVLLKTELTLIQGTKHNYSFKIVSKAYNSEQEPTLHCEGKVRLINQEHASKIKQGIAGPIKEKFVPTRFRTASDFYTHMEAVLGDYFQYGPYFQAVNSIDINRETKEILLDLKMEEAFFQESKDAGYMLPPSLMDGALQSFIYFLMDVTDISGIPMQAENFTMFSAPTSGHLTCHFCPPPAWSNMHEKGQLVLELGERNCGSITLYDKNTGALVAHLGQYSSFHANSKRGDLISSKKLLNWQPKFIDTGENIEQKIPAGEIAAIDLINALEQRNDHQQYACRIIELTDTEDPNQTVLKECIKPFNENKTSSEYWLCCSIDEGTKKHYETFNHIETAVRFANYDIYDSEETDLSKGLLRIAGADVLLINYKEFQPSLIQWREAGKLLIPGGMLLVLHEGDCALTIPEGWSKLRSNPNSTLIQIPFEMEYVDENTENSAHWIIGNNSDLSQEWANKLEGQSIITNSKKYCISELENADEITSIDFFVEVDQSDVTGEYAVAKFAGFVKELVACRTENQLPPCRLNVITKNAAYQVKDPASSTFCGAVRSLTLEIPAELGLEFRLIDLGEITDLNTLQWLYRNDIREKEIAIRNEKIYVPRVLSLQDEFPLITSEKVIPYRLFIDNPGQITGLQLKTYDLPELGANDVEIEVSAAALNFRDIMVALGKLPLLSFERSALGHEVGMEASGTIVKVGSAVQDRKIGEEVVFMKGGCIANRIVTDARATFLKPSNLTQSEAAGVMSVYVTAYYALVELSRLKKGQKFLIHSAMGGVGQAAIALAKHIGAEIYATAGSVEKREKLLALGATAAFDSHSFSWYDDLMEATNGEGVDVVLNSLAGHHINLCLEALKPGGWHCEIGKVDIYADHAINLCVFRKNLRFIAIDVDRLMMDDPALSQEISKSCLDLISEEILPPLPITTYALKDYPVALRSMMNGEHQGKLILEMPKEEVCTATKVADKRAFFDPTATYLVTGAFGGFGLRLLSYLAASGAKHITLMDRDSQRKRSVEWVRQNCGIGGMFPEVEVQILQGDASKEEDVVRCINDLQRPLKGVFHLAGTLDDQLLENLTPASFKKVFAAKANGAWYLHEATQHSALDYFVVSSSVASAFGSPGQLNYCAANAFLDGLMAYRKQNGLPGLAFNMGAVAEAGMASRDAHVLRIAKAGGMPAISALFAFSGLDYALRQMKNETHLITALFKRIPWTLDHPDYMRFGSLMNNQDCFSIGGGGQITPEGITAQIVAKVSELCGHEEIDIHEPFASFGLNSISVSELSAFVNSQFNYQVSIIDLMTKATTATLVDSIINRHTQSSEAESSEEDQTEQITLEEEVLLPKAKRIPSVFANKYEDHFEYPLVPTNGLQNGNGQLPEKEPFAVSVSSKSTAKNGTVHPGKLKEVVQPEKLSGTLPPDCQTDINTLRAFIRDNISTDPIKPAISPTAFKQVFITGATGFIGRFILRDLLTQHKEVQVHCLVRATDATHGKERLQAALELAEIWEDQFADRIHPVVGDMGQPQFGLTPIDFDQLSEQMDAVYHFAADLTLASPYRTIRKVNTLSMQNIFELCFAKRMKHLFYASTLGIFPQYFSQFGGEYMDKSISHQAQPDLEEMKRKFPLGFVGYPWSKLVVEQSLFFAKSAGLPIAIFRLPVTGMAAETGYTQINDVKVRIALSALSIGKKCKNLKLRWTEPVDTISNFCTAISLNENRKNTIYQCCNPKPVSHDLSFLEFGIDLEEVSYADFKQACMEEGEKSPLDGYWTLVDYFAPQWFGISRADGAQPVSDQAIKEDCPFEIEWPGLIAMSASSYKWIERHRENWEYTTPNGVISTEILLRLAKEFAEQSGVSFEAAYPKPVLKSMDILVNALNAPEAKLLSERRSMTSVNLSRKLYNLAALAKERKQHPAILEQRIERPIFIVGINRTGTTFMHNLLSQDRQFNTLKLYESTQPVMAGGDYKCLGGTIADPRRTYIADLVAGYEAEEQLRGIHKVDIDAPEEEFGLLEHSFSSWSSAILYNLPSYCRRLEEQGSGDAYKMHHQIMQHFNWQRTHQSDQGNQWLLKMPFHLMALEELIEVYPDALFIQTHRDPCEFMSSWNHLVEQSRATLATPQSKKEIGKQQLDFMSKMLSKAVDFRTAHPELEDRWIDVSYYDFIKEPMQTVRSIYGQWDKPLSDQKAAKMEEWLHTQNEQRSKESRNKHQLADYMLTKADVDQAFAAYLKFVERREIVLRKTSLQH